MLFAIKKRLFIYEYEIIGFDYVIFIIYYICETNKLILA